MLISFDNLGSIGVVRDTPDYELPYNAWSAVQNIRFDDGKAIKFQGHEEVYATPSVAPYHAMPVPTATDYYWVYSGLAKVYATDGTTHSNITRQTASVDVDYSASADINWNGGVLNGLPVLNNGVDAPQVWDPVSASQRLVSIDWDASNTWTANGYSAKVVRPFKNFLVALDFDNGTTRFPRQVRWSDAATAGNLPSTWDDTDATALAGFTTDLEETAGFVIDCLPQRDANIIYKEDSTWRMQLVGGNDVFSFQKMFSESGILSRRCVKEYQGKHVVFTPGPDLIMHDGQNITSLLDNKWRKWLAANIDPTNYERSFLVANYAQKEMWACFPSTDSTLPDKALVWNWHENTLGERELPLASHIAYGVVDPAENSTWDSDSATWDSDATTWDARGYNPANQDILMADPTNTKLYLADSTKQFDGVSMTSFAERTGLAVIGKKRDGSPIVDLDTIKYVNGVYPKIKATAGTVVNVYIGSQDQIGDSVDWSGPHAYTVGTDYKVDVRKSGRLLAVRFETTGDDDWELSSYELDIEVAGAR